MRESCTSGSVRGARGNSRPYRNVAAPLRSSRSAFELVEGRPVRTKDPAEPTLPSGIDTEPSNETTVISAINAHAHC